MTLVLVLVGLFLLGAGGEGLIRGGITLGERLGLSPVVIGMVIVGFGTSLPELAVSLNAMHAGSPAIAVGNAVGSNIANILMVLAVAALLQPIIAPDRLFVPDGLVLLAVCALIPLAGAQGLVPRWQGGAMLGVLALLLILSILRSRSDRKLEDAVAVPLQEEMPRRPFIAVLLMITGLAAVVLGAELLVEGGSRAARSFGVSESFIGLTVVAIGTSLPELAGSCVAALRGHTDIAYGNIVGSSIFNVLAIFGASVLVGPMVVPWPIVWFDSAVMIGAVIAMLVFVASGRQLSRFEGLLLLVAYGVYVTARYQFGLG
jgi:cation:H+ antiporter